jgi:uncharacterized membrane protein YkoI
VLTSVAFAEGAKVVTLPGLDALPPKARQTAKIESKGATIRAITREIENGETVYELAMKKADGRTRDIIIGEDGTVLLAEDQVTLESLSPPIRNTFVKKAGKGTILRVESVALEGVLSFYEAQVRTGKKISEIKVDLDGKLIPAAKP